MPAAMFIQLVLQVGLPVAQQLVTWAEKSKVVTSDDWPLLDKLGANTSADSLAAAGGAPAVPKV